MPKIISDRDSVPDPTGATYTTLPQSPLSAGVVYTLRRLASSSVATQVQCAPPKNNFLDPPLVVVVVVVVVNHVSGCVQSI